MIGHDLKAVSFLRRVLPDRWDEAASMAEQLAAGTRYLPWADRARAFDSFFWSEASRQLTKEAVTAIVNRQQAAALADPAPVEAYARFCRACATAALLLLDDPVRIQDEAAALARFFSLEPAHQDAALDWIGDGHHTMLARGLPSWPGCAFLLLILSPSDSAESFLARDAFWAAMLGQC